MLAAARAMVRDDGYVLVADERTQRSFTRAGGAVERLFYGWSISPVPARTAASTTPSVATGTVMRPTTLERYARAAGFAGIEILRRRPRLLRFYRLLIPAPDPR